MLLHKTAMSATVFIVLTGLLAFSDAAVGRYSDDTNTASYSERLNYIDLELLQRVCDSNKGNVLVSPASVKSLLGLLLEGADNNTAEQIRFALRLGNDEQTRVQLHKFQLSLQPDGLTSTIVQVANRLFLSDKVEPKPKYQEVLRDYYKADTHSVNMARTEETAKTINQWVNQTTHGFIPTLVESGSLDPNALLVLANAVFFRGLWETAFESRNTAVHRFKVGSKYYRTPMMENVGYFRYAAKDFGQILEMEYKDKRYSMVIILPREENGVDALSRDLTHLGLLPILKTLNKTEVLVSIPRFTVEFDTDLVDTLKQLKITDVFDANADLSKMVYSSVPPLVSKVFHKAKIQVNEQGATAAAATGALVVPLMGNPLPRFVATHPFLFFIRDVQTNGFLFAGRLSVPDEIDRSSQQQPASTTGLLSAAGYAPLPPSSSSWPQRPPAPASFWPQRPSAPDSFSPPSPTSSEPTTTDITTTPGGIPLEASHTTRRALRKPPSNNNGHSQRRTSASGTIIDNDERDNYEVKN